MLDIILKHNDIYAFIEAKHIKEAGGSQDKQIKELIDIVKTNSGSEKFLFCAFMDGVYSNKLLIKDMNKLTAETEATKTKISTQQAEIEKALSQNPTSFWFNTAGFAAFAEDFAA